MEKRPRVYVDQVGKMSEEELAQALRGRGESPIMKAVEQVIDEELFNWMNVSQNSMLSVTDRVGATDAMAALGSLKGVLADLVRVNKEEGEE